MATAPEHQGAGSGEGGQAFRSVLESVGRAIVRGDLAPGHPDTVDGLVARTGASRSIVREATRVLVSLGLLSAGRRVGLQVRPRPEWNVLDPTVIGWRLAASDADRQAQVTELRQLRVAVEPEAARLAAGRRTPEQAVGLTAAARAVQAAAVGTAGAFLAADQRLHGLVLEASGNPLFARLGAVIDSALAERALHERTDLAPDPHDVALHVALAEAVAAGDRDAAASRMREIVTRTGQ